MTDPNPESSTIAPETIAPLRRSVRPPRKAELPIVLRPKVLLAVGFLLAVVFGGVAAFDAWRNSRTTFRVVSSSGEPLRDLRVEFFAVDASLAGASPTAKLGDLAPTATDVVVGTDLSPGEALLRIRATDHGVGSAYVKSGRAPVEFRLGPPVELAGHVVLASGDEHVPIAGATVQAFGNGSRGILVEEVTTDADGAYRFEQLSASLEHVTVRALAHGHGVAEAWTDVSVGQVAPIVVEPTRPVHGRILAVDDVDLSALTVRVYKLPGVTAEVAANGTFVLDHIPPEYTRSTLVVGGLDDAWTHRKTVAAPGDGDVVIELEPSCRIRGMAVDADGRAPIAGTKVFHEHGPAGLEVTTCDAYGTFEIGRVPAGEVLVTADVLVQRRKRVHGKIRSRPVVRRGEAWVFAEPGQDVRDVVLLIR